MCSSARQLYILKFLQLNINNLLNYHFEEKWHYKQRFLKGIFLAVNFFVDLFSYMGKNIATNAAQYIYIYMAHIATIGIRFALHVGENFGKYFDFGGPFWL